VLTSVPRDRFVSTVIRALASYVGQNMAGAAVRMQLEKHAISGAVLTPQQVETILAELAPALHVFIGRAKTQDALTDIQRTLHGGSRS
jgi:hypothetical protein